MPDTNGPKLDYKGMRLANTKETLPSNTAPN